MVGRMRNTLVGRLLSGLLMAGLALGCGIAAAQQKLEKLTVPLSDGLHYFPVYVARGGNFFAKEGIEPDWINLAAGPKQIASLVGGSSDMLAISLIQVIKARAEGNDVVVLGSSFDVYGVKVALTNEAIAKVGITPGMPIDEKIKRMQGLKIGMSSSGSSTDTLIRSLFLARGYDPDKVVNLVPLGNGAALLAAFEKKLIDGLVWPSPIPEIVEYRHLGKTVVDPFSGEVPELNGVPYLVLATSRTELEKKPELIKHAMRAIIHGMEFSADEPEESCKMVRRSFPDVEEPVFKAACETYRKGTPRTLQFTRQQLDKTLTWMNLGAKKPVSAKFEDMAVTVKY
jgi:NitT/TauT family transport system substrate-binding protein